MVFVFSQYWLIYWSVHLPDTNHLAILVTDEYVQDLFAKNGNHC